MKELTVAFQGMGGAYSEQACRERLPNYRRLSCKMFDDVFDAVDQGVADVGMLPVENSMAGVVSDSYDLLAVHNLSVVGEHFLHVRHALLGLPQATLEQIHTVYSHPQALAQCQTLLKKHGWQRCAVYDTAGAAMELAKRSDPGEAALASEWCAEIYGLQILQRDMQDSRTNTTRFLLIARQSLTEVFADVSYKTSLIFEVRNIPASLYKCLGGFATNGVNLTRLESRPVAGKSWTYNFYLDFQGTPLDPHCKLALEELNFFTDKLKILGFYPEAQQVME
ncbi:MAG: hypothetical protein H7832_13415 [Magnetococcus sp. DMHC-6]